MNRTRVGVLRGGPSDEYEVSLKSGNTVLTNLSSDKYHPIDIFIDKTGAWHVSGLEVNPHDILSRVDVVVNALHGKYGEDGKVQALLDRHAIPYTGSGSLSSAIAMHKGLTKNALAMQGIKMAKHIIIEKAEVEMVRGALQEKLLSIFRTFPLPVVVKPVASGSSVGVSIVKKFEDFENAVLLAFESGDVVMVEEFVPGVEATCAVIDNFRGDDIYALPPIEIRPTHGGFFDYEAKYEGKSNEIVPGNFKHEDKEEIMKLARTVHKALGLRHYSRTDFIVSPRRGIYMLEVNTLPGLTEESLLPKALKAVGVKLSDFLDHIIHLAIDRK